MNQSGEHAAMPGGSARRQNGIAAAVIVLTLVMIATQIGGFLFTTTQQRAVIEVRNDTREMRIVQQALVDQKESVEDYLLTDNPISLQSYYVASGVVKAHRSTALRRLDAVTSGRGVGGTLAAFDLLERIWSAAIDRAHRGERQQAVAIIAGEDARHALDRARGAVVRYIEMRNVDGERHERLGLLGSQVVLVLQLVGGAFSVLGLVIAFRTSATQARGRKLAMHEAVIARQQVERLLEVTDMLQSASDYEDAKAVLETAAHRLLPGLDGCLYLYNNSRDRLDLMLDWGMSDETRPVATIAPTCCWALKRGKPHTNSSDPKALRCDHYRGGPVMFEVPMMARGEVHGLLCVAAGGPEAEAKLAEAQSIILALADAMSLALSAIALREKLRNQALRDPLTGLYNRRYMEDMLQRFVQIAERNGTAVSAMMVDLDHFKKLNDEHGHLMGDNVLRAAAAAITGSLREEDVACRYGGEELTVLLPGCGLDDALRRAETIRARIEHLSELHGARISASIGVASIPETSAGTADLLATADAALYRAKHEGRNRVAAAPLASASGGERPQAQRQIAEAVGA